MVKFETVAALWHSNPTARPFRIDEFLAKPGVLVLGDDPALRDSLWPINALLLKALSQEILRRPNCSYPRHWFVLDEFPAMEKVDCLPDLLRRGRSKGASVLLGMQSLEAISEVHGKNAAEGMLSECAYKTFLHLGGPGTADWAERLFGKVRRMESVWSESWGKEGYSRSVQHKVEERAMFLSSVFMDLPFPERDGWLGAISDVPCHGSTFISRRWFNDLLTVLKQPADIVAVDRRDGVTEQTLQQWDAEEEALFCPPAEDADAPKEKKSKSGKKKQRNLPNWKERRQLPPAE